MKGDDATTGDDVQEMGTSKLCGDRDTPELCAEKTMLCDDEAHKENIRMKCALSCGVCDRIAKAGECVDGTDKCAEHAGGEKGCSDDVKSICPKACGACEGVKKSKM